MGFDSWIELLSRKSDDTAKEKELTRKFAISVFPKYSTEWFNGHFNPGKDGGIDFFHYEQSQYTFHIVQTKFRKLRAANKPSSMVPYKNENSPEKQTRKIFGNLFDTKFSGEDVIGTTNRDNFMRFLSNIRAEKKNNKKYLKVWFLTTSVNNDMRRIEKYKDEMKKYLNDNHWKLIPMFEIFDYTRLPKMYYSKSHGLSPMVGRKILPIDVTNSVKIGKQYIETGDNIQKIKTLQFTTKIDHILDWFAGDETIINNYLHLNVREFEGDNVINKKIQNSYLHKPNLFYYKHNGIFITCDSYTVSDDGKSCSGKSSSQHKCKDYVAIIEPQIVNGGQTLRSLLRVREKKFNDASVSVRLMTKIDVPNQNTLNEFMIDITKGLNNQNKVLNSDLHSNDFVQILTEEAFNDSKTDFTWIRKRGKDKRKGKFSISMPELAKIMVIVEHVPVRDKGPSDNIATDWSSSHQELVFGVTANSEPRSYYNQIFPLNKLQENFNLNHRIMDFMLAWRIYWEVRRNSDLVDGQYIMYWVMWEMYKYVKNWWKRVTKKKIVEVKYKPDFLAFILSDEFIECFAKEAKNSFSIMYKASKTMKKGGKKYIGVSSSGIKTGLYKDSLSFYRSSHCKELYNKQVMKAKREKEIIKKLNDGLKNYLIEQCDYKEKEVSKLVSNS